MATIWENINLPPREKLKGVEVADCTVIGGGLAGIMIAAELERRGFGVLVLEADRVLSGATRGTTAKLTAQHGLIYSKLSQKISPMTARLYYDSNREGVEKIRRLVRERDIDCDFFDISTAVYGRDDDSAISREMRTLEMLRIEGEMIHPRDLPFEVKGAVEMKNQAQFHPLKFAGALSKNLKIYEKSPVVSLEDGKVTTPKGVVRTNYIICATHYPFLNIPGFYFLRQHQYRSYALALDTDKKPERAYLGIDDNLSIRSFDRGIIVGGMGHRTGYNQKGGCYMNLLATAKRYYPKAEVITCWSNQDVITHDGLPFIGRYSVFSPRMFVATGFNKWGMSLSAVASNIVPDLICGCENKYEKLYSPFRTHLKAAAVPFFEDAAHAVVGISRGMFSKREERCTHLGAKLHLNRDDGTLECPCHGSQFSCGGKVEFSPAVRDVREKK